MTTTGRQSRAERAKMPLAKDVVKAVAVEHGVCVRPVSLRATDTATGETNVIDVPCGATLASKCPSCAEKARRLRMAQCREGWHLEHEPDFTPDPATDRQRELAADRADLTAHRDSDTTPPGEVEIAQACIAVVDEDLADEGVRGHIEPGKTSRRTRSTRRRQDAPDLPRRPVTTRTIGQAYEGNDGKTFRPSLFWTGTLDTYGRVKADGTPVDPDTYDYRRAVRDALHFPKLCDRTMQNLRRYVGWDVQYFATVEPQKRGAPHLHVAMRGTLARRELKEVMAATYHQVWWPPCDTVHYDGRHLPVWDADHHGYVDPDTSQPLPTWEQALDAIGADPDAQPLHVCRWGPQMDAQGVIAGSPQANEAIGYMAKYQTKQLAECLPADTDAQRAHLARLQDALRYECCSPTCANWLRYGIQPKNARPQQRPGYCKGKAHRREHLGYGGRRVLVSRKWSGKTLADHRHDRRQWVLDTLGHTPDSPEANRLTWELVGPDDPDITPLAHRLLRAVAERVRWRTEYDAAKARADGNHTDTPTDQISATAA